MQRCLSACLFVFLPTLFLAAAGPTDIAAEKAPVTLAADVKEMVCLHCVKSIEQALRRELGLERIYISLKSGQVIAADHPQRPVSPTAFRDVIEGVGFKVTATRLLPTPFEKARQSLEKESSSARHEPDPPGS